MTNSLSTMGPAAYLFNDSNDFMLWRKYMFDNFPKYGIPGKAILIGVKNLPSYPNPTDMIRDANGNLTGIKKYDHISEVLNADGTVEVSFSWINDGLKDYKRDVSKYEDRVVTYNVGNNHLVSFILGSLGSDVRKCLNADVNFIAALHKPITDTFDMFNIIVATYSQGTGRSKIRSLQQFLALKQGDGSYESFVERLKDGELTTLANYGSPQHAGYIALDVIIVALLLGGVDQTAFQFKLATYFAENPTGNFPASAPLIKSLQIYARESKDTSPTPLQYSSALIADVADLPVVSKSSAIAAVAVVKPVKRKCATCNCPINHLNRHFKLCTPCHRDSLSKVNLADLKPGPIVQKPTTAQLLAARAMLADYDTMASSQVVSDNISSYDF